MNNDKILGDAPSPTQGHRRRAQPHTPGPLVVGDRGGAGWTVRTAEAPRSIVARVPRIGDAHLYAAAPEMYWALKDCVRFFSGRQDYQWLEQARAAIDKAEGRT